MFEEKINVGHGCRSKPIPPGIFSASNVHEKRVESMVRYRRLQISGDEERMPEPEKITIIEGPPPTFELVGDTWLFGLTEGPIPSRVAFCRVRTANGPALVERCYRAWRQRQSIFLEFRSQDGLTQEAPIVAVRWLETPDGHVLMLWIRLQEDEIEIELGFDFGDFDDDVDELDDNLDFGLSL